MSIKDYEVRIDLFEPVETTSGLAFPCSACVHGTKKDNEYPCVSCDHNSNCDTASYTQCRKVHKF